MFDGLAREIDELDVPLDGAALAEGFRLADRLVAKLTMAAAAFDAHTSWEVDGATSMTAWLRHHAGMTGRDARRTTTTGKRLRSCPVTATAWEAGNLSGGQVAAVVANLRDATVDLFAEHEPDVVPVLAPLTVDDTAKAMHAWSIRADAVIDTPEPVAQERSLHLSRTLAGRHVLSGDLDVEAGDVVATALRLATTGDVEGEPARTGTHRRADALVDVCRWYLDHQHAAPGGRHRPHLNLVVDLHRYTAGDPAAGATIDGYTLTPETISRLLCDAGVHRVVTDGAATILDYGRTTRTVPAPLWNALVVRDRRCRWPGCDRPPGWGEAHHLHHWEHGGTTDLSNLVVLCTRHHHIAHLPGWHVKLLPDTTVKVTHPDGHVQDSRPPPRC